MTCVQVRPTDGRYQYTTQQSYTTEAECLQACKAGACCEGTTCSVKPQCQCQGTGKTFKGVGTTCSPNPCLCCNDGCNPKSGSNCSWCWCLCGDGAATYPRFINVTISGWYSMIQPITEPGPFGGLTDTGQIRTRQKSVSGTITLTNVDPLVSATCPHWRYGNPQTAQRLPVGVGGMNAIVTLKPWRPYQYHSGSYSTCAASLEWEIMYLDTSEFTSWYDPNSWVSWATVGTPSVQVKTSYHAITGMPSGDDVVTGPFTSGVCFSAFSGATISGYESNNQVSYFDLLINGVQQ